MKQWTAEHWDRVSPYLDQALDLSTAERELWLAGLSDSGSDPALVDELRALLAQHEANSASRFLERSDLAEAHLASGYVSESTLDLTQASDAYERALALAPGNAVVLRYSGFHAVLKGRIDAGLAALRRAVVLDPLARGSHSALGQGLYLARRYAEAVAAFAEVISLEPEYKSTYGRRGFAYYGLEDLQSARTSCETKPEYWVSQQCLAVIYDKQGRHADAESALAKLQAPEGDAAPYQYATIYAQWGNRPKALESLETALQLHDTGLEVLKSDPLLDPLRKEPRFQAIERELKFPN